MTSNIKESNGQLVTKESLLIQCEVYPNTRFFYPEGGNNSVFNQNETRSGQVKTIFDKYNTSHSNIIN